MFDRLLKSKFQRKCKSAIKITKTRIDMIRRKRTAMQKFLKNDIADLLRNNHDTDAYHRAEGLLIELNLSTCYDFVEQCCVCISNHLSIMNKQGECPEECREAVPSLMFAAARFADLPELRELRSIFTERYRNSLDLYVNKEFVQKLKSEPPTKDMKLQLLQDIALESGVEWDIKTLEQKLYNPPPSDQDWSQNTDDHKYKSQRRRDETVEKKDEQSAGYKHVKVNEYVSPKRNENIPFHGREKVTNEEFKWHSRTDNAVPDRSSKGLFSDYERLEEPSFKDIQVTSISKVGQQNDPDFEKIISEKEFDQKSISYGSIPPPYTKPKLGKNKNSFEECLTPTKLNGDVGREDNHLQDDSVEKTKLKPKSVRRRPLKPPPGHNSIGSLRGPLKEDAKKGLQILNEDGCEQSDEEEMMMDRLLIHYSDKKSPYKLNKAESALKPTTELQGAAIDASKIPRRKSIDGPPSRVTSLPVEPTSSTEATKGHARASSFQPEMLNMKGHVHPKLPDYDDFVAQLSALRSGK